MLILDLAGTTLRCCVFHSIWHSGQFVVVAKSSLAWINKEAYRYSGTKKAFSRPRYHPTLAQNIPPRLHVWKTIYKNHVALKPRCLVDHLGPRKCSSPNEVFYRENVHRPRCLVDHLGSRKCSSPSEVFYSENVCRLFYLTLFSVFSYIHPCGRPLF